MTNINISEPIELLNRSARAHQPSNAAQDQSQKELKDAAVQFEALLISSMLKSMRSTLSEDSLTGSEHQTLYMEMMDAEIAQKIASGGGLGLQQMITQQIDISTGKIEAPTFDSSLDLIMRSRSMMSSVD